MGKIYLNIVLISAFLMTSFGPLPVQAQELSLPKPGTMIHLSPPFSPAVLKGIKVHPENPFRFDFILDQGDLVSLRGSDSDRSNLLKEQSTKLIKYFLASLTIPEKDLWVTYQKDSVTYQKDSVKGKKFHPSIKQFYFNEDHKIQSLE